MCPARDDAFPLYRLVDVGAVWYFHGCVPLPTAAFAFVPEACGGFLRDAVEVSGEQNVQREVAAAVQNAKEAQGDEWPGDGRTEAEFQDGMAGSGGKGMYPGAAETKPGEGQGAGGSGGAFRCG